MAKKMGWHNRFLHCAGNARSLLKVILYLSQRPRVSQFYKAAWNNGADELESGGWSAEIQRTIRYEGTFAVDAEKRLQLELGEVGETAEVFVNGKSAGVKIAPPYTFDLSHLARKGENALTIDVTNTLVYRMHDGFSAYHAIAASGLIGPVRLFGE